MSLELSYDYHGLRVRNIWRMSGSEPIWITMNDVGAEGWELCGVVEETRDYPRRAIFKREAREADQ
jgi:hypothetical protein